MGNEDTIKVLEALAADLRHQQCSVGSIGESHGLQMAIDTVNDRINDLITKEIAIKKRLIKNLELQKGSL